MRGWGTTLLCALALSAFVLAGCGEDDGGQGCVATETAETTCNDNLDNDCDGLVDLNDTDCNTSQCTPTGAEVCDNADNDCNGQIDENLTQACQQDGQDGVQTCTAGVWGDCVVDAPPPVEVCNNADDDNDGQVDEDLQQACNTACGTGVEECASGQWVGCDAPAPETEVCDGRDNDCDGEIDEQLTRNCDNECGEGTETCSLGNWFGCTAPRPGTETCDNVDNDCDGDTDENLSRNCGTGTGLCQGVETCQAGQWANCNAPAAAANDAVCDNKDEDCDGQTDEDCAQGCEAGTSTGCVGVNAQQQCVQGTQVCGPNQEWGPCQVGQSNLADPGTEICNGRDDDCDGGTDESFARQGQACGGGPNSAPLDEGECVSGMWACSNATEVCQGSQGPVDEICDDLDNDCDGETDNDLPSIDQETNNTCPAARNMGTIKEGDPDFLTDESTLTWTGSLYPEGDVDYFYVSVDEGTSLCGPLIGPDDAYAVVVLLYNMPEGVDYDVCIEVVEKEQNPADGCAAERLYEVCETVANEDGEKLVDFEVVPECFFSDDTSVIIKIQPHEGSAVSCLPYAVSIWALTVPPAEE